MLKMERDFAASYFKVPIPLVETVDSFNLLAPKTSLQALGYAVEERPIGAVGHLDLAIDFAICVRKGAPGHAHRFVYLVVSRSVYLSGHREARRLLCAAAC